MDSCNEFHYFLHYLIWRFTIRRFSGVHAGINPTSIVKEVLCTNHPINMESDFTDKQIDQFEDELKAGDSPEIERYLEKWPAESRPEILLELIALEIFHGIRGRRVANSDYARFGENAATHAEKFRQEYREMAISGVSAGTAETSLQSHPTESDTSCSHVIGPYKLLRKLGEGGMGTVWLAEQEEPVKRRVALKTIKFGMNSAEIIARFQAEKEVLAMMEHQNIAIVLDGGTTENGQPYFVMELVNGIPITQYCDEKKMSIEQRLKLFVPVCKAVQHAHQKGILHRDLKPTNVLVADHDGEPVPKVIDFGMAKAIGQDIKLADQTMLTEFGRIVGTIQYMSPEQAEMSSADIDTRTDVYSLGVMLYELLSGSTPLDKNTLGCNTYWKALEMVREKDPPTPSSRLRTWSEQETYLVCSDGR